MADNVPGTAGEDRILLRFERRRRELVQADFHIFGADHWNFLPILALRKDRKNVLGERLLAKTPKRSRSTPREMLGIYRSMRRAIIVAVEPLKKTSPRTLIESPLLIVVNPWRSVPGCHNT